ncbi:MAG: TerB family tellurite resistance protein [Planctomycetes bacterium]|nr:TerB family tellurite resistance protein [Planctomycetota bacterium]
MIIFGTRGVTSTRERGEFFCPECGQKRPYARKRVRSFFTLYFIPLIPLKVAGEFVECQHCKSRFHTDVLEHDPEKARAAVQGEFESSLRRVMLLTMLADGRVGAKEIATIVRVFEQITSRHVAPDDLLTEAEELRSDKRTMQQHLEAIAPMLNAQGQELVIRAVLAVAAADGEVDETEMRTVAEIAQGLGMMPAHFRGLLAEIRDESTSPEDD